MNRAKFYEALRASGILGKSLSQRQVDGISAILDAAAGLPLPHVANILAQVQRETGGGMYPIKETVMIHHKDQNPSDATVISRLDRAFAKGELSWVSKPYWRGGMFGRGQIQITHEDNYGKRGLAAGVDLLSNPGRALELPVSAAIAVNGMAHGLFTGKKLSDYDGAKFDHEAARAIVNGDGDKRDKGATLTVGQGIAKSAKAFEAALRAADTPTTTPAQPSGGIWAAIAAFFALFGKAKS